jgi:hypothetical protein
VVSLNAQQSSVAHQVVKPVLLVLGSMAMKANCIGWSAGHLPTINYSREVESFPAGRPGS